ncbi:ABC transporter substrate-binding protein [Oceanicella actignis]|uniref:ABC transporter substrate-binding protein n=1 Tax=Oceanicella actignis TaxID=1189325 RepID=UPI0011E7AC55|nr:ABC transporter substrate-binding protein [Oceanicella actignis]TYO90191.1 branched-chain amino acid transport system substrate-binding protein [Oceanicella actignis]
MKRIFAAAAAAALIAGPVLAETQGVTDDEIVIGSHTDLSGPFAAFGAPATKAAQLYFDEVNAKGGVHGRKIRFVVEDHGYQVPKAVQAVNKLVNRDKVFAMLLSLGTPHNLAAFKILDRKGIPNISPLSSARQMLQEPADLKFVGTSSYYDGTRAAIGYMAEHEGAKSVCTMFIPSDFGEEIHQGAKDEAAARGLTYAAETTHKPDEVDFVGALGKLQAAGCDTVAVALGLKQVITAVATAKKIGWNDVKFVGSSAAFHTVVAKVPGGVTEGFYAGAGWTDLEGRMDDPVVAAWVKSYTEATGESFPGTGAMLGRSSAEIFVKALEKAGRDLTVESFKAAMESLEGYDHILGANYSYGPDKHVGNTTVYISKVEGGKWVVVGEVK